MCQPNVTINNKHVGGLMFMSGRPAVDKAEVVTPTRKRQCFEQAAWSKTDIDWGQGRKYVHIQVITSVNTSFSLHADLHRFINADSNRLKLHLPARV